MIYTIIFDATTGIGIARGQYSHEVQLGQFELQCTPDQWETPAKFKLVSGAIVAA